MLSKSSRAGLVRLSIAMIAMITFALASLLADASIERRSLDDEVPPKGMSLVDFKRFALNGLLAPLLDDAQPPRWTDVALPLFCGGGSVVTVNGLPMRIGALMPSAAFTLRFQMNECQPFADNGLSLSGLVALRVEPRPDHLHALVDASALRIVNGSGPVLMPGRFEATLALGPRRPN